MTNNVLVARNCDDLAGLAADQAAIVLLSVTTLGTGLVRRLERRASTPARRLAAVSSINQTGIPVGVTVAPIIPGWTDHEYHQFLHQMPMPGHSSLGKRSCDCRIVSVLPLSNG